MLTPHHRSGPGRLLPLIAIYLTGDAFLFIEDTSFNDSDVFYFTGDASISIGDVPLFIGDAS